MGSKLYAIRIMGVSLELPLSNFKLLQVCLNTAAGARRYSGNGGKMIIIINNIGDGGNDIQRLDSTVERYFLHGLAEFIQV